MPRGRWQEPVAHAYNLSYSGGRDQEDWGLKPAQASSLQDPSSKNPITKKSWWSDSRYRPWVQAPVPQTKRKKREKFLFWNVPVKCVECLSKWVASHLCRESFYLLVRSIQSSVLRAALPSTCPASWGSGETSEAEVCLARKHIGKDQ
jgi:hypothetical protein